MKYRKLGASPLNVSEIALGSWLTYGVGVEEPKAKRCVRAALDAGINFFDTSNIYGRGAAETVLAKALEGIPRDRYVLATKLFFPMTDDDYGLSARQIEKQLDASLRRLKVDYVDLYQCHRYDEETPLEETMRALTDAVQSGKARYLGFSEWSPAQIEASFKIGGAARFVSSQPQYSMLWRAPEPEVFPLCERLGVSQIVWSPLAQGLLTGKYQAGQPVPEDSRAASAEMGGFIGRWMLEDVLAAVQRLKPIADKAGFSMAQLALAWVLRKPNVACAIIGATKPEQVVENAAASGKTLSPELLAEVDSALAGAIRP
jgi:1-deoxyxylulose-5-phosphate synthase